MRVIVFAFCIQLLIGPQAFSASLKEMYELALPASGYDKYLVLETGVTYTGGLWIGGTFNRITARFEGLGGDVYIAGNGAILDLQGEEICLAYCNNRLDIENCVIINGNVRYRGYDDATTYLVPEGSVRYVTFYKPHDYGVRLFHCGAGILVERNIVVDAVDTGPDFMYLTGIPNDWLATGASFALSLAAGSYEVFENWSYHSDPAVNPDPLRHFVVLCDYG
jgi:hypothetical protein